MFHKLPLEKRFAFNSDLNIYMPGSTLPVSIRHYGHLFFSFSPSKDPDVLLVRLKDARMSFLPFALPKDLEGKGRPVSVDVKKLEIDKRFYDLDACEGTLNRRTGYFEFNFVYKITEENVPLLKQLGGEPMIFRVTDRGTMDLRKRQSGDPFQGDHPHRRRPP